MTDAVIFDLDGVLVDSEPVWERVRRRYVDTNGGRWQPDTQRRLMGMSTGEWAGYLGELGVPGTADQIAAEVIEEMAREYEVRIPVVDGAPEVVHRVARHWPLGLASSSPPRLIEVALAAMGLTDQFRVTLSTEQVARGKPAPDVYLAVADRLGVPADRCVAVEDSSNGVRSAAAAGMRVVAVPHASYPLDPDAEQLAALVIPDITELTEETLPPTRSPRILEVSWGRMVVDGLGEDKDFKLYPGGGRPWDWTETGTRHEPGIQPADVEELLANGATRVVLSEGFDGVLRVDPATLRFLAERDVEVYVAPTGEAVELYNTLATREPVGGLFHSTC
ncbi:HAD-IA family hydrolase [Plantactinospora solaniradicis]|uniref:HAD-IA family hydrolase n=1 Tax=Plantactinospora solaniradicis TaxID=1723736 RepID=A0ABW1KBY5_9ACTN